MKKALPLIAILAIGAVVSACTDSGDNHGVEINRGGFLSNLFGAEPVQPAPAQPSLAQSGPQASPAPDAAPSRS